MFTEYIKSGMGMLRASVIGIGFFNMVFAGAGHDLQALSMVYAQRYDEYCNLTDVYCPIVWPAKTALAFIISCWMFSVIMLACAVNPALAHRRFIYQLDTFGHAGAGGSLILVILLVSLYIYWWTGACDKFTSYKDRCGRVIMMYGFHEEVKKDGGITSTTKYPGYKNILWAIAAGLTLVQTVLCFVIFIILKKKKGKTEPTASPSKTTSKELTTKASQEEEETSPQPQKSAVPPGATQNEEE